MAGRDHQIPLLTYPSPKDPRNDASYRDFGFFRQIGLRGGRKGVTLAVLIAVSLYGLSSVYLHRSAAEWPSIQQIPLSANDLLNQCASRLVTPENREDTYLRKSSDRFEAGTRATLIKNVTLWTGARNGTETVKGDVLLEGGVVKGIGYIPEALLNKYDDLATVHAGGAWVTPGLGP